MNSSRLNRCNTVASTRYPSPASRAAATNGGVHADQRMGAIERLLINPSPDERRRGVVALAELQGPAAMNRLVNMALHEPVVRVVDAILSAMRTYGTQRQLGMTLYRQAARPDLHTQGLDLLVKNAGMGPQREQVRAILDDLLGAASADQRIQGINAYIALERSAGVDRLVRMAPREHTVRVVDTIIAAVRAHGTPRQVGMTLWGQGMKPELHKSGLDILVQHPGTCAQREQVRAIISTLLESQSPEQRRLGVNAIAKLDGAAGMRRLVNMVSHERAVPVVDAIVDAMREHGTLWQLGITLWTQAVRPNLQQQGLDLLVRYCGSEGAQREYVREIITQLCNMSSAPDRIRGLRAHAALEGFDAASRLRAMIGDNNYRVSEAARVELRNLAAAAPPAQPLPRAFAPSVALMLPVRPAPAPQPIPPSDIVERISALSPQELTALRAYMNNHEGAPKAPAP